MKRWMFLAVLALAGCDKAATPLSALDTAARRTCMDTIEARAISRSGNDVRRGSGSRTDEAGEV